MSSTASSNSDLGCVKYSPLQQRQMSGGMFSLLSRLKGHEIIHDEECSQATVVLPPVSSDDINRTGNFSIWRILQWLTTARLIAYHQPNPSTGKTFLEYDRMTSDLYTFIASTKATVSKDLYSLLHETLPSGSKLPTLAVRLRLGYIGTCSLNTVAVLLNHETGTELVHSINQVVTVSKSTRRPLLIPDWWKTRYSSAVVDNDRLIVAAEEVPSTLSTSRYDMKVPWNEIDSYGHTNYQSYVRFCFDAAADAVNAGRYATFDGDILRHNVATIQSLYESESRANDILTIISWQSPDDPRELHFNIHKDNGTLLFHSRMQFYPLTEDASKI